MENEIYGGSWFRLPQDARISCRMMTKAFVKYSGVGFRCAADAEVPEEIEVFACGGSWDVYPQRARASGRVWHTGAYRVVDVGFRCAADADTPVNAIYDQPAPTKAAGPPIWDLVIADMRERDHVGRARYGTPLQANNGRDALVDAYQEALDLVVYLRQAIAEREGE